MVELQDMYEDFEKIGCRVIAVSQEDKDLESYAKMPASFEPRPRFQIAADLNRAKTTRFDRTTAYLIDREGVVRQIFPMMIHHRPTWQALLREARKLN